MHGRWGVLALLFTVRLSMAFQFQTIGALSPLVMSEFGVSLADIGLLIGLYLSPGILFAFPGGALGRRFGDKRVVLVGLVLMICGGAVMTVSFSWDLQIAGRLIAGIGGILLNVMMSKMVIDWFAGREIGTAMGIFVNSWPVGIALALLILPPLAELGGYALAMGVVTGAAMVGLVLFATLYPKASTSGTQAAPTARPKGHALVAIIIAGAIWGLYNSALAMIFGFGPAMLAERGWTMSAASSATSVVLWLVALSVPLGGFIADRTGRRTTVLIFGLLSFAAILAGAVHVEAVLPTFVALGLVAGLAAGPIMSLPSQVLTPEIRAYGMGLFFTLFYICIFLAPILAGALADASGSVDVTFGFGAAMLVTCFAGVLIFRIFSVEPPVRSPQRS